MMKIALFFLALVVCGVYAQTTRRITVDEFDGSNTLLVIQFDTDGDTSDPNIATSLPASRTDFFVSPNGPNDPDLLGGERDLELTLSSSPENRLTQMSAGGGSLSVNQPNDAVGEGLVQWDGEDNSIGLSSNGLSSRDLTDGGLAYRIEAVVTTDIDCIYTFTFYSPNGNRCEVESTIDGNPGVQQDLFFDYDDFSIDNCDMENIGAVELKIDAFDNVDTITEFVALVGDPDPSPSPTPSRQPNPSASSTNTFVPNPSSSRTPAPSAPSTPDPNPVPQSDDDDDCHCYCPAFTCALMFDPDDDENDAYYFDDDDDNRSGSHGSGSGSDDDDDDSSGSDDDDDNNDGGDDDDDDDDSSSVTLSISMAVLFVCFALLF